jgi:hypothetical protein
VAVQLNFVQSTQEVQSISLFCWILDVSRSPFPVDIDDSKTVGHLKKAIVKENSDTFAHIEADQFILWKVSSTFQFGHAMLIALLQDLHPDLHHSDSQE